MVVPIKNCRVPIWGASFTVDVNEPQTQQAQYNEFGREAGSRTGPLEGLGQGRTGSLGSRIVNGVGVG